MGIKKYGERRKTGKKEVWFSTGTCMERKARNNTETKTLGKNGRKGTVSRKE